MPLTKPEAASACKKVLKGDALGDLLHFVDWVDKHTDELKTASVDLSDGDEAVVRYLSKLMAEREAERAKRQVSGAAAGPSGGADRTCEFLNSIVLPTSVPRAHELPDLFKTTLLDKAGNAVKLPVHPALYAHLATQSQYAELLATENASKAWALSIAVSSALHPEIQLYGELGDEFGVACRVDELFGRFLSMMGAYMPTHLSRKRNRTEQSLTTILSRPDFMVHVKNALLFKGEDKHCNGKLADARQDLLDKVKDWSAAYHGQVEFLLCYACAGSDFELYYLSRNHPGELFPVLGQLDTNKTTDKIKLINAAILTYGIIAQQASQLPRSFRSLLTSTSCSMDGMITFSDGIVHKRVDWSQLKATGQTLERLQRVYKATSNSVHCVKAVRPPRLSKDDKLYSVGLQPYGTHYGQYSFDTPAELAHAIRCVLLGVADLHAAGLGHGDLRWHNVIKITACRYCVIDLELAVDLGSEPAGELLNMPEAWEHGTALADDSTYTAASDLYQVGAMLQLIIDRHPGWACHGASDLVHKLRSKAFTTAREALAHTWLPQNL